MAKIQLLSEETIDKIAAGEVIERPASVVKELVENAIDAKADAITVEIKDGGVLFIRVTDNGDGIEKNEVKNAFFRHATSKLHDAQEIMRIKSLGFRGEALSSIAAVSQVEMITKTREELSGIRYVIEGAKEIEFSEVGVPHGTTVIVRNLFYNTPVRKKFLKTSATEGGYIAQLCEQLALSKPDISFKFINNGQVRFHTSGNGDLKELIFRIYGKDIAKEIIPIHQKTKEITLWGMLGKPVINRSNRNFEHFFVNGRYIKSSLLAKAAEEGYRSYLMQHKFPFFVLNLELHTGMVDVNVHPTKMDVRFTNPDFLYDFIVSALNAALRVHEMIPEVQLQKEKEEKRTESSYPEPFEINRIENMHVSEEAVSYQTECNKLSENRKKLQEILQDAYPIKVFGSNKDEYGEKIANLQDNIIKADRAVYVEQHIQMNLFEEKILSKDASMKYNILGQIFDTYWLIEYEDCLLIMDQHAAHEKVKYEKLLKKYREKTCETQNLDPPMILSLSGREHSVIERYSDYFKQMGFMIDQFGGNEIAVRSVPLDLYGKNEKEMFLEVLDELLKENLQGTPEFVFEKLASMACKAAVKGGHSMTTEEIKELLNEMLSLDNPYHCPHGRPTLISMSRYEIEKKFKRVL